MARVGLLTGGGDCPGLNAVIRAIVRSGLADGHTFIGFSHGWAGVLTNEAVELDMQSTVGLLGRGGTVLGTSRTNPFAPGMSEEGDSKSGAGNSNGEAKDKSEAGNSNDEAKDKSEARNSNDEAKSKSEEGRTSDGGSHRATRDAEALETIRATLAARELDALITIGGEDTLGVALRLHDEGIPVVGVPKTIDNDLAATDATVGFHTAVQIVTDAIDRLHTTAESHNRVMVVEVMGRHAGWIAIHAGIAGGADAILVPERPFDIEEVCAHLRRRHAQGRSFSIVVVAEGAAPREGTLQILAGAPTDAFGHVRLGGIGVTLEHEIEQRTGYETRATILGHVQRGGTPLAFDRVLATRFGVAAMDAVARGRFGVMVALRGTDIVEVPLQEALREPKLLDPGLYQTAELFFG